MSAVADVLNAAADLIERDGWCQGSYRGPGGEHCASAALLLATGTKPGDTGSPEQLALYSKGDDREVSTWNDAPGRTQAEVIAALRAAAERAA